jgi:hypothetical protein
MHFDFVDLRLLTVLADTANLARAASRCHLSAPAATNLPNEGVICCEVARGV